ncbi:SsrA-binding protein [Symmachiella macrocystis]|uniref:SsrA-binding protein n=1 Tax=Symmachiella macrocystis TaxID=2527985 RepID=A0A5C6BQ40_9PLAN|nr:SsrA-binding protein SmpB [Symmachiella macrocystis]TWU14323.1 SsrA-binding protein [Symmachiella macrocystis]
MGKKSKKSKKKKSTEDPNFKTIARNRKARHQYEILDEMECGIVLQGSEVKSARGGKVSLDEAYGRVQGNEVYLVGCDIAEYPQANLMNHEPKRTRKLLLHRREISKFAEAASQNGLTLVPTAMYFKKGVAKVKLATARGRKLHDKRDKLKKDTAQMEIRRAMTHRR